MIDQAQQALELLKGVVADPDTLRLTTTYGTAALTAIGAVIVFWKGLKLAFHAAFGGGRVAWWIGGGVLGVLARLIGIKRRELGDLSKEILTALTNGATLEDDGVLAGSGGVVFVPPDKSWIGRRIKVKDEWIGGNIIEAGELKRLHRQCESIRRAAAVRKAADERARLAKQLWAARQPKAEPSPAASWTVTHSVEQLKPAKYDIEDSCDGAVERQPVPPMWESGPYPVGGKRPDSLEAIDQALQEEAMRRRAKRTA